MKWFVGNVASGSAAGATTSLFLYHLDYVRTRLATDSAGTSSNKKRQFNGLFDVYRKTLASDGIRGLYRGFGVSIVGITLYRGMYFGLYDTMKPIVLIGSLQVNLRTIYFEKLRFFVFISDLCKQSAGQFCCQFFLGLECDDLFWFLCLPF